MRTGLGNDGLLFIIFVIFSAFGYGVLLALDWGKRMRSFAGLRLGKENEGRSPPGFYAPPEIPPQIHPEADLIFSLFFFKGVLLALDWGKRMRSFAGLRLGKENEGRSPPGFYAPPNVPPQIPEADLIISHSLFAAA
ncbi:hypothetical protein BYT27DRAFT_7214894 [Phlegmacium glaucopus]|nr:hypothetical protein BYT27DRAFT_7214894 [Phlegmacium glaucopus]